ncbi:MAG: hypothetical protein HY401_09935, partial [Elusimicrobia bacterium]|nr:hypothetical protein [Elusimicrobiota bacterium]
MNKLTLLISIFIFLISSPFAQAVSLSANKTQVVPGETITISFNSSQAHWGDWIGMVPFNASAGTISYSGASYQDWRYLHGTKDLSS